MPDSALQALRGHIAAAGGILSYREFTRWALYDRDFGYYRRARQRVGLAPGTDFYTNLSFRSVFAPLVIEALTDSELGDPSSFHFVEIGVEPEGGLIRSGDTHPFASVSTLRIGDPICVPERAVVFANEWLDAQPFHRFRFIEGTWREIGIVPGGPDEFAEVPFPTETPALTRIRSSLPLPHPEGYTLDLSFDAPDAVEALAETSWEGRFVTIDYGHSWDTLLHEIPQGSGRAYYQHRQESNLLARPGEQDLTCSVCWDWIERALTAHGFGKPERYRQETFFMKRAQTGVARIIAANTGGYSPTRNKLLALLHPGQMGARFQVLVADRIPTGDRQP